MQTNNVFSIYRLMLLGKQSWITNKKQIGYTLAGFVGILVLVLLFFQSVNNFRNWENKSGEVMFIFLFFAWGIIYSGFSFPGFRSKEKTIAYLILPASASEKFVFELVTRIFIYILIMPLLFWCVANLEGVVVHYFVPDLTNYRFSFSGFGISNTSPVKTEGWITYMIVQGVMFAFITAFTGASHFSKSPLFKTIFTLTIIGFGYALYSYLLFKGFNLKDFHPANDRVLFMRDKDDALVVFGIAMTLINLCLLAISWFGLKEKEV